jgi:hypothetical protein
VLGKAEQKSLLLKEEILVLFGNPALEPINSCNVTNSFLRCKVIRAGDKKKWDKGL